MAARENSRTKQFVQKRARIQRLSDLKLFSGWVQRVQDLELVVRINASQASLRVGDQVFMNVDGENIVAEMKCNVLNIEGSICYLVISSTPKYTEPQFEPRTAVVGISGCRLDAEGSFHVSDLSPKGMGIEADFEVSKGAVIRLNVTTQMGEIVVDGEVRYCRKMDGGRFRIGLSIQELSRIESAKWLKLLNVEDRAA